MTTPIPLDLQDRAKELAHTIREGLLYLVDRASAPIHQVMFEALASVEAASAGHAPLTLAGNTLRTLLGNDGHQRPPKAQALEALEAYDQALSAAMRPAPGVKLVIWDLDDTFWHGTLAEGDELHTPPEHIDMLRTLTARGIVNSICSKNKPESAQQRLEQLGVWDQFVFPHIAFAPKGELIKDIIELAQLRAENVLFIDDNELNLDEARFYNPGLQTLHAHALPTLLSLPGLQGKPDGGQRLAQYKLLEQRAQERQQASSNDAFLRQSDIRVRITPTGVSDADRVHEMLTRTNQLNFTKQRISLAQVESLMTDPQRQTATVSVKDRFGDHGVVGWYCLHQGQLEHFLFSCRIINLGIEQFVYDLLGRPKLEVVGDTASSPFESDGKLDYITLETEPARQAPAAASTHPHRKLQIYASGACDMYYLVGTLANGLTQVTFECNTFKGETRGVNVSTEYLRSCFEMSPDGKDFCARHFHNYTGQSAFKTRIFDGPYDYALFSFNDDAELFIYEHRTSPDVKVVLSESANYSITPVHPPASRDADEWLSEQFHCHGLITPERFRDNLLWIAARMPSHTRLLLMTLPEHTFFRNALPSFPQYRRQCMRLNREIRALCASDPRFSLVEMNDFITDRQHFTDYVMHLRPERGFMIACEALRQMAQRPMASDWMEMPPTHGSRIALVGKGLEVEPYLLALTAAGVQVSITASDEAAPERQGPVSEIPHVSMQALAEHAQDHFAVITPQRASHVGSLDAIGFSDPQNRWILPNAVFNLDWKEH